MTTAFVFPGQGSQFVGMGKAFFAEFPEVREMFDAASAQLGMDLATLCFEGPEEVLTQTENVQPAVTLVNLACLSVVGKLGLAVSGAAGHSLGEYSALYAAGVFSLADVLELVQLRGQFMRDAARAHPGGMLAVMGLRADRLEEVCEQAGSAGSVEVANHNSPGQVILTGELDALEAAAGIAKKAGAVYTVPLKVSGAWHSRFMQPASDRLAELLADRPLRMPAFPVISNESGQPYDGVEAIRSGLVRQVVAPVRWVDCVRRLIDDGCRLFVELGPGSMLAGLIRDIDRSVTVVSVESIDALDKLEKIAGSAAST